MSLKSVVKRLIPGIAWQHPLVNAALWVIDPLDWLTRKFRGLGHLPPYSVRVRSNGFTGQFGGKRFARLGRVLRDHLMASAALTPDSEVLEIGCGCGRTAFALGEFLEDGRYTGMDIEPRSLQSCQENKFLRNKKFPFDLIDVQNDEYNPEGAFAADEYRFPYPDNSKDAIFLVSVFTHMLTADVRNYIAEIARMLKPGGTAMITTYLVDHGIEGKVVRFPFSDDEHFFAHEDMPEIAVGYRRTFYETEFSRHGDFTVPEPLWGAWRKGDAVKSTSNFGQDIVIAHKN